MSVEAGAGAAGRRVALVTGAARGIGRAIALELAAAGCDVAVHFRSSRADAEETCRLLEVAGARWVLVQADLADRAAARAAVAEAHAAFGRLDILVNNVGNYLYAPWDEVSDEQWDDIVDSNLHATLATCQAAVPLMRERGWGRIVNLGYAGAGTLVARPNLLAYAVAKTGVLLVTRSIARAEAATGITANVVAPGVIETSVTQPLREIPAGRTGLVEEVSKSVRFLVSDEAAYVTGQEIAVAGGWNL
jgi:NAD(P)-dependent dehydrogenase (short-subunit alcohol dehydrogenase family)